MNRRELLKYFSAGALVAPIIGSAAREDKAAQLIEVPNVRPVELFKAVPKAIDIEQVKRLTITFEMEDGTRHSATAKPDFGWGKLTPHRDMQIDFYSVQKTSPAMYDSEIHARFSFV